MATYHSTDILQKLIEENVQDIRKESAKTLEFLNAQGQVRSGKTRDLRWNIIDGEDEVRGASMTTAGTNTDSGGATDAQLSYGGAKYYANCTISRVDMVEAATSGVGALRDLFGQHLEGKLKALRRKVNQSIWTGNGDAVLHAGMIGMTEVWDNTKPYAGIDPATNPLWKAIHETDPIPSTPRALTRTLLENLTTKQEIEEVSATVYVCHPNTHQAYRALFDSIAGSYSIAGVNTATRPVDLGHTNSSYEGIPIITDPMCPQGVFVGVDASAVNLFTYDLANADRGQLQALGQKDNFGQIRSASVAGMNVNIALLPEANPGNITFQLFVVPQLRVRNRRAIQTIPALL